VLLMPRGKKGGGTNGSDAVARASRGPAAPPEAPAPDRPPVAPPPEIAAPEAPAALQADPSTPSAQPDQSGQFPLLQPNTSNPAKPGALTPPPTLSPESINQQLQQMYQQRAQMTQQDHYTGTQPTPVIPGVK
jgi:hypothetical protein